MNERTKSVLEVGAVRAPAQSYDVAILGGGLAGLTLAIQIKQRRPDTSILVLEKREGPAPLAAFKVGESTVAAGAHYYAEVIGMADHLSREQYVKCGLRFFLPSDGNRDITKRVELGPTSYPAFHTYQVDRGLLENRLAARVRARGIDLAQGGRVKEIELGDPHTIEFDQFGDRRTTTARWIVDAAGRASLLKRKLGLAEDSGHHINAAWFRLSGGLDLEHWGDGDAGWISRMSEPGLRQFSTNHLMGEGYWVWLIPLATGPISIGVCADPRFHPFEEISEFDRLLDWLREHEPQLAAAVEPRLEDIEDFLRVEDFSYDVAQMCSTDRWSLVGEAAAFADPFFSPGSDFICLSNTFTTELVTRELGGEDVAEHVDYFNRLYKRTFEHVVARYRDTYPVFGNPWVLAGSLSWDFFTNHTAHVLLLIKQKMADLEFMRTVDEDLDRLYRLNIRAHAMFRQWHELDVPERPPGMPPVIKPMIEALIGLAKPLPNDDALRAELKHEVRTAEAFLVALFGQALKAVPSAPAVDRPVNPYAVGLDPDRWEADGLFQSPALTIEEARAACPGIDALWDPSVTVPAFTPPPGMGGPPGAGGPPPGAGGPPGGPGGRAGPPGDDGHHRPAVMR